MRISRTTSFDEANQIGKDGIRDVMRILDLAAYKGRYAIIGEEQRSLAIQKQWGDIFINTTPVSFYSIEQKTDRHKVKNFFLETYSNKLNNTPGWLVTSNAHVLWYYFQREYRLFSIWLKRLQEWAFDDKRIYDFRETPQTAFVQDNLTCGRVVPIDILRKELAPFMKETCVLLANKQDAIDLFTFGD